MLNLVFNSDLPYKRKILGMQNISPKQLPFVFHTSNRNLQNDILDPRYCRSLDYKNTQGNTVPVSFILPFPHGNRTADSNIHYPHKKEIEELAGGMFYSYLTIEGDKTRQDKTRHLFSPF